MSAATATRPSLRGGLPELPREAKLALTAAAILAGALLPFFVDGGGGFIDDATVALAYVVMALGLNIIVGFAGLLDLGYVAFFAIGAYTMGYFGSLFHITANDGKGIHILVSGQAANLPGIHLNFLIIVVLAIIATTAAGMVIGLPTLRLRGDYIAIVTLAFGEIVGPDRDQRRRDQGLRHAAHRRAPGHHAGRQDPAAVPRHVQLARAQTVVLGGVRDGAHRAVRELPPARLAPGPRVDRAARGRGRGGVAWASRSSRRSCLAYGTGAAFGGVSGAFLGSYLNTVNADQFQFSFSIFVLAMIILGGLGSIWGVVLGAIALSFINNRLIPDVLNDVPAKIGLDFDLTELSFGIFGFLLVIMMVLRPEGLLPEKRRQIELQEGIEDIVVDEDAVVDAKLP